MSGGSDRPQDGGSATSASEELSQWLTSMQRGSGIEPVRAASEPPAQARPGEYEVLPEGQMLRSELFALEQGRKELAARARELDQQARQLAVEAQRIERDRQMLVRDRDELRSQRMALDEVRRRLAQSQATNTPPIPDPPRAKAPKAAPAKGATSAKGHHRRKG